MLNPVESYHFTAQRSQLIKSIFTQLVDRLRSWNSNALTKIELSIKVDNDSEFISDWHYVAVSFSFHFWSRLFFLFLLYFVHWTICFSKCNCFKFLGYDFTKCQNQAIWLILIWIRELSLGHQQNEPHSSIFTRHWECFRNAWWVYHHMLSCSRLYTGGHRFI